MKLSSYIPQSFAPAFDYIRLFAATTLGYDTPSTDATEVSRVRQSLSDTEVVLREAEERFESAQRDLEDLFKPDGFGKDGEWKKLDGLCLEKDTGEYVPPARQIYSFLSFPQVYVRGLPLWGSKTKGKYRWFRAVPRPLHFLEER